MSKFGHSIPRAEINAVWSIIAFFSDSSSLITYADSKEFRSVLSTLIHYNCSILPKYTQCNLPTHPSHVETLSAEMNHISVLLSSSILGRLPDLDSFISRIVDEALTLESMDKNLNVLPTMATDGTENRAVMQLWNASDMTQCAQSSRLVQADLSKVIGFEASKAWGLSPSTQLLQNCCVLTKVYASLTLTKKARWKRFSGVLNSLVDSLHRRATDLESKEYDASDDFARHVCGAEFLSLAQDSAYYREASCFLLLSSVIARMNNTQGLGVDIALNKKLRERVSGGFGCPLFYMCLNMSSILLSNVLCIPNLYRSYGHCRQT